MSWHSITLHDGCEYLRRQSMILSAGIAVYPQNEPAAVRQVRVPGPLHFVRAQAFSPALLAHYTFQNELAGQSQTCYTQVKWPVSLHLWSSYILRWWRLTFGEGHKDDVPGTEATQETRSDAWYDQEQEMIDNFFERLVPDVLALGDPSSGHVDCTAKTCEAFAERILETNDIHRVDNQGATSYTLVCPSQAKIVQFRLRPFDEEALALATRIYGSLVPTAHYHSGFPLPVYVSPLIPGQIHIFQDFPKDVFPLGRQLTTITELAQFVAKSALQPLPASAYSPRSKTKLAKSVLATLIENRELEKLEPRFAAKARTLSDKIALLDTLPPVLSHADLAEVNIMVNSNGNVTGIIDFEDVETEAFGVCLVGIYEGFFGVMRGQKWSYFDQPAHDGSEKSVREVLEAAFWEALWSAVPPDMKKDDLQEAVMVALDIGIVGRYFVRGLLEGVDLHRADHRISLEFARGLLLDR